MASSQTVEVASPTSLGMFGRLPTELRLQIFSELLDDSQRFDTSLPNHNAMLFVAPQLTSEIYDVMYRDRTLNFTISAYEYTQASLKGREESLTQGYYFSGLDIIPCEDQHGNRLASLIPDLNGKRSGRGWLDCPFPLFKEIVFRIPAPKYLATMIDAWEKICFLVDLFQRSKHRLPNVKVVAVEGRSSESWSECDTLIPKASDYLHQFEDLCWLDILLQPFRQLEMKAASVSYQSQDRGFYEGTLSTLTEFPSREFHCQEVMDFWSLRFDLDLDLIEEGGNTARMLRFRRMLHWSGAHVKRTVDKLSQIKCTDDDDDHADTNNCQLRTKFEAKVIEALVERSLMVRYSHPLTQGHVDTDIIGLEDHPDIWIKLMAEENLDPTGNMSMSWVRNRGFSLRYRFRGLPGRGTSRYKDAFGSQKYLNKPVLKKKLRGLFRSDPQQFIKELSKVALSW